MLAPDTHIAAQEAAGAMDRDIASASSPDAATSDALHPSAFRRSIPELVASPGLIVEVASADFVGEVVGCSVRELTLRDRRGRERRFLRTPGAFIVDDVRVTLTEPPRNAAVRPRRRTRTNSGSVAVETPARIAKESRILVEGVHDADLVERVWGDDLRVEGVVVEVLHGVDDLPAVVDEFRPDSRRRLGVLLDHLVDGSKESRIAASAADSGVLVTGHPFVDIWAAVRPEAIGIRAWPDVPRNEDWKAGVTARLGFPDEAAVWDAIRRSVRTWRDLDRSLIRAVEELIDFVTAPGPS